MGRFVSEERLETLSRDTGFLVRRSKLSFRNFLDTLFQMSSCKSPTLTEYSIHLEHNKQVSISKQGLNKRFNENLKNLLASIAKDILSKQMARKAKIKGVDGLFPEIRLMDSTEFKLSKNLEASFPGYGHGKEAMGQVQYEYDLLSGKVKHLKIGAGRDSDSLAGQEGLADIPTGALLIRDLGYSSPKVFKMVKDNKLFFISRGKSQWNFYINEGQEFKILTTNDIIKRLKGRKSKYLDIDVYVGEKAKEPVRLVANLLTEEQKQKRIKGKTANRGRKLGKDVLEAMGLNLFVTNVEREKCDASCIYELYRLRWQVELVFKAWKSTMNIHRIHQMNATRVECILWVKLIWTLLNWAVFLFIQGFANKELSFQKVLNMTLITLTTNILSLKVQLTYYLQKTGEQILKHGLKEYKKGPKMNELFELTF